MASATAALLSAKYGDVAQQEAELLEDDSNLKKSDSFYLALESFSSSNLGTFGNDWHK
jgi:hypothetical protein